MLSSLKLLNAGLWIGLATVGLGGLPFLPAVHRLVGAEGMPLLAAAALAAAALAGGWAVRRRALAALRRRLREAERLAAEGFPEEAEDVLEEAFSLLDRAGVSAAARRRALAEIGGRRARLLLDRPRPSVEEEAFLRRYLAAHPDDHGAARRWLTRVAGRGMRLEDEEAINRIAAAHPDRPDIQAAIAGIGAGPHRPGRAAAGVPSPAIPRILAPPEAENRKGTGPLERPPAPAPAAAGPRLVSAARLPEGAEEGGEAEPRFRAFAAGAEEEGEEPPPTLWRRPAAGPFLLRLGAAGAAAVRLFARLLGEAALPVRRVGSFLLRPAPRRVLLAAAALAGIALGVRLGLESLTGPPPEGPLPGAAPQPAGETLPAAVQPFTLQVAAYLKEESALRRVEELRQRGLDAYLSTAERGGKRWYQVRVSHFADPQSAREAGRALRDKGWIEDFYVANTAR